MAIKVIICLLLTLFSMQSSALGSKGHWLVCQLAYIQLPVASQNKIDQILLTLPVADKRSINAYLKRNPTDAIRFADACNWPDAIKSQGNTYFNHWHYLNVDRRLSQVDSHSCKNECITTAILYHSRQFQKSQQVKALLFLGHWIGDIHQPLHVSYQSDLGGNKIPVSNTSKDCQNLHRIWDTCLLRDSSRNQLLQQLKSIDFEFKDIDAITPPHVNLWATESLNITRKASLQYCHIEEHSKYCRRPIESITLSNNYMSKNSRVLLTRIHLGGQRLNYFLLKNL